MSLSPDDLVTQGRRHLVCGDITKAVENFQKACEILAGEFGDFDEKLAVPNLLYGTALLELSRMESTVIGNALDGIPEDEDDESSTDDELIEEGPEMTNEEKEDLSNKVLDAMCEEEKPDKSAETAVETNDAPGDAEEPSSDQDELNPEDQSADSDKDGEEGENEVEEAQANDTEENGAENDAKSDDDDISNLQIAWEVIEVAKKIFSQSDNAQNKLKVAECFEKLGEISREKEDYEQAISDLKECLAIRSSLLSSDDRDVAETHFQLGTTYAVSGDLDSACQSFRASADCLIQYTKNVKAKLSDKSGEDDDETKLLRTSLAEVEELIPEIQRRCADVEEDLMAEKMKPSCSSKDSTELLPDPNKPASDITHLVRKKRPMATETESNGTNGTKGTHTETVAGSDQETNLTSKKLKLVHSNGTVAEAIPNGLEKLNVEPQDQVATNGN